MEILFVITFAFVVYKIYVSLYFTSKKFKAIKNSIEQHTKSCNALNDHIENLKSSYDDIKSFDYGERQLYDNSNYNMKRKKWENEVRTHRTHDCSTSVLKNASNQPFKYLCKYFDIKINEETLSKF